MPPSHVRRSEVCVLPPPRVPTGRRKASELRLTDTKSPDNKGGLFCHSVFLQIKLPFLNHNTQGHFPFPQSTTLAFFLCFYFHNSDEWAEASVHRPVSIVWKTFLIPRSGGLPESTGLSRPFPVLLAELTFTQSHRSMAYSEDAQTPERRASLCCCLCTKRKKSHLQILSLHIKRAEGLSH